jgi:hypothetical protein
MTNNNQSLTGAFSHANIPGRLWRCPHQPVPCVTGAESLCPPSAVAWPSGGGQIIADGFPLDGRLGRRCRAMEGDGSGVGTTMAMTTVMTTTDGWFCDLLTMLMVANYAIKGAVAGVLFRGTAGCWLQVTNISFN